MLNIKISIEDFNNLKAFLERVQLSGKEVPAFLSVMQTLSKAEVEDNTNNLDKSEVR